ncbi:MAG: response regulator [Deltaproteobacteria bacterium]|nr:response regulator [Deltaproteobacteria bacterium]
MNAEPRLLVVDDEEVVCKSCSRIFSGKGYKVETSTSSTDGLRMATSSDYDAILLDIKMPGMDGLEFLEKFREDKPDVPVIMITGYSSVPTAAAAMRLGAVDYIPKPFSPEELTGAVGRLLGRSASVTEAPRAETSGSTALAEAWSGLSDDVLYLDDSWVQVGEDGTVRTGAFLSRELGAKVESLRLPKLGERLTHGLPMAAFQTSEGIHTVPSPVSGEVIEVNTAMGSDPSAAWSDPCRAGWIARVKPARLAGDLRDARAREVVLVHKDAVRGKEQANVLTYLGCRVQQTRGVADTLDAVGGHGEALVLLDAESLADKGPEVVGKIHEVADRAKVVVMASSGARWETDYRKKRVFYYAVEPFADEEIVDILYTAFRPVERAAVAKQAARGMPTWIRRIRITNRQGEIVELLSSGGLLDEATGLGREIVQRALDGAYPVRVTLGQARLTPMEIRRSAGEADRVLVVESRDLGGLPGALERNTASEVVEAAGEAARKVTTFAVQPERADAPLTFDARVSAALAEAILQEMVAI